MAVTARFPSLPDLQYGSCAHARMCCHLVRQRYLDKLHSVAARIQELTLHCKVLKH